MFVVEIVQRIMGNDCPYCGKMFSTQSNMKIHIENVHEDIPYEMYKTCTVCNEKLKTKQRLLMHLYRRHGIRQRRDYSLPYV